MIHRSVEVPLPCLVSSFPVNVLRFMKNHFGSVFVDLNTVVIFTLRLFKKPLERVLIFE